jgi:hypothetical protein
MRLVFMTPWPPAAMGSKTASLAVLLLLSSACFAFPTSAHEQKTMAVILLADGVASGNITDPSFVQGNALWFKMEDSTNNTTMVVRLDVDRNGVFNDSLDFESSTLTESCALDENGSLVDESCAVSAIFSFASNATVGEYVFWIHRNVSGVEEIWEHTVTVHQDVHVEEGNGPSPGDCFGLGCDEEEPLEDGNDSTESGTDPMLLFAFVALFGMIATVMSIRKERHEMAVPPKHLDEEA